MSTDDDDKMSARASAVEVPGLLPESEPGSLSQRTRDANRLMDVARNEPFLPRAGLFDGLQYAAQLLRLWDGEEDGS